MKSITEKIEEIRREKGLKQEYIASQLSKKQHTYSTYMRANDDIPFSRISKIADILDIRVIDIITWPDKYEKVSDRIEKCEDCKSKDNTISHLNEFIDNLKSKVGDTVNGNKIINNESSQLSKAIEILELKCFEKETLINELLKRIEDLSELVKEKINING